MLYPDPIENAYSGTSVGALKAVSKVPTGQLHPPVQALRSHQTQSIVTDQFQEIIPNLR